MHCTSTKEHMHTFSSTSHQRTADLKVLFVPQRVAGHLPSALVGMPPGGCRPAHGIPRLVVGARSKLVAQVVHEVVAPRHPLLLTAARLQAT